MTKSRVLFLCVHNSARSQMAQAILRKYCGECFDVESAGLEPGVLNPLAIDAMAEVGIDISGNPTQDVFDLFKQGRRFEYVVTVCDEAAERCPIFPAANILHWYFADPSAFTGTFDERLAQTRTVRDEIAKKIEEWCDQLQKTVAGCACTFEAA